MELAVYIAATVVIKHHKPCKLFFPVIRDYPKLGCKKEEQKETNVSKPKACLASYYLPDGLMTARSAAADYDVDVMR